MRYFIECGIVGCSLFVTPLSWLPSIGRRCLSLPQCVVLLFDGNLDGSRPVSAATHAIAPCGVDVVFASLPIAVFAVVAGADRMKTMQMAVAAHAT